MFCDWASHATSDASFVRTSGLIVKILVMTASCMSRGIGSTHEMRIDGEKSDFIADLCLAPLRLSAPVRSNWEESGSHHVLALRSPGRGGQTHHPQIRLSCERDSHWNHSQSSQTWDGGLDVVNVDSKDYFSVSAAKAEPKPRPDKILGKQICQDPCSQAWHLLNKLDKPFYVLSASSDRVKSQNCKNKTHPKTVH